MAPDEGMRLIIERGRLMQDMPPGGMVALSLPEREALMIGADHELQVAAINAPDLTVLSGQIDRIEAVERLCRDRGIDCKRLRTSHAFHSSMMDPAVEAFGAAIARLQLKPPNIPIISTATGEMLTHEQATSPALAVPSSRPRAVFRRAAHVARPRPFWRDRARSAWYADFPGAAASH